MEDVFSGCASSGPGPRVSIGAASVSWKPSGGLADLPGNPGGGGRPVPIWAPPPPPGAKRGGVWVAASPPLRARSLAFM